MFRQRNRAAGKISRFSQEVFVEEKLYNFPGFVMVAFLSITFGYMIANQEKLGLGVFGLIIGFFTIITCLLSTEAGLYINILYSFFAFHFSRLLFGGDFQVGVISDILVSATFLSLFLGKEKRNYFPRSSVMIALLIMYGYISLELFNPYAHSFLGWYQTIRKVLAEFALLFISYNLFTNYRTVRRFIIILFALCAFCGLYGCIQQWHGLFNFELAWVQADSNRFGLIFIAGDFRKFSTMSDPTAYAIVMASCSVFFMILATRQKAFLYKAILMTGVLFMIMGMGYSGTRTANVMVIAGLALFILMTFDNKQTRLFALAASVIFALLLWGPYSNATINRFRTTFLGSKDESYKVRVVNRTSIQPYIYSHPIGGGLGTTGAGGLRFNPGHRLAGFPPDSGYLKFALELGWIGLAILCTIYFTVLRNGVNVFFCSRIEHLKIIYAGATALFFSLYIAQFAQDAIGQITDIVIYYPMIAITLRADTLEQESGND